MGGPRIERAEAEGPLGIFDGPFGLTSMGEDGGPKNESLCRRGVYLTRAVDRIHRCVVIMRDETDCETGGGERLSIIGPSLNRGPRMLECGLFVGFLQTAAHVSYLMAQSCGGVGSG